MGRGVREKIFLSQTKCLRLACGSAWGLEVAQGKRLVKKDGKEGIGGYGLSDNAVRVAKLWQMGLQQEETERALLQPCIW